MSEQSTPANPLFIVVADNYDYNDEYFYLEGGSEVAASNSYFTDRAEAEEAARKLNIEHLQEYADRLYDWCYDGDLSSISSLESEELAAKLQEIFPNEEIDVDELVLPSDMTDEQAERALVALDAFGIYSVVSLTPAVQPEASRP
jgi:hypothetical protein